MFQVEEEEREDFVPTRVLSKEPFRALDWRLEDLEIGDTLLVPRDVRKFWQVYKYAKDRSYQLERHFRVDRHYLGTLVTRTAQPERAKTGKAGKLERPGLPGEPCDWGIIKRKMWEKRWRWPFKYMEPGDMFRVAMEEYTAKELRARKDTAAWKYDKHFTVEENPITAPGFIVCRCLLLPGVGFEKAGYGVVKTRLRECFIVHDRKYAVDYPRLVNFDLDKAGCDQMQMGEVKRIKAQQVAEPPRSSYIFELKPLQEDELARFAVDLFGEEIVIERVDAEMDHAKWDALRVARIDEALS